MGTRLPSWIPASSIKYAAVALRSMMHRDYFEIRQEGALMRGRSGGMIWTLALACVALPAIAQGQQWLEQFGTRADDFTTAAALDAVGGVYVVGATGGELGGAQAGDGDAWVARYGGAGVVLWIRQFGTSRLELALAAARSGWEVSCSPDRRSAIWVR